eukprot:5152113-Amphidinium_carterae.2
MGILKGSTSQKPITNEQQFDKQRPSYVLVEARLGTLAASVEDLKTKLIELEKKHDEALLLPVFNTNLPAKGVAPPILSNLPVDRTYHLGIDDG